MAKSSLKDYWKSPKGKFFCLALTALSIWALFTISPFNKSQNNVFAIVQSNFINIEPNLQPASNLIIGEDSVVSAVASPLFICDQSLGSILADDQTGSSGQTSLTSYTVGKGDTISSIADKFGISVETILLANELTSSKLKEGQELMILPVNGIMHMVEKGESVKYIANKYGSTEEDILNYNNLPAGGNIYVGDILIVPGGKTPKKPAPAKEVNDVAADTPNTQPTGQVSLPGSYFIIPTVGSITQRAHFSYTSAGKSYYNSVDIANAIGTPIVAAAGGTVQIVKSAWPYGNYITIAHPNGVVTLYAHMSAFAKGISSGVSVTQGQVIGYMGNTGKCISLGGSGSHLHFETRGTTNPLAKYLLGTKVAY
ncbi:MAG: LysM peptidoglycan-binding domain-containing protein [Candidatus Paceibacterota bacterium]